MTEDWDPEQAGAELKALFDKANEICSKPIYQNYQEDASADEMDTPSADSLSQNHNND